MIVDQKYTNSKDKFLLQHLGHLAFVVGSIHGILPSKIVHSSRCAKTSYLGLCYKSKKVSIIIRHKEQGKWCTRRMNIRQILTTLAHELSHLRYFDHSPEFWAYHRKIKNEVMIWNKILNFPKKIKRIVSKRDVNKHINPNVKVIGVSFEP